MKIIDVEPEPATLTAMDFSFPIISHPNELPDFHFGDSPFYVYRQLAPARSGSIGSRRAPVLTLRLMHRFSSVRMKAQAVITTSLCQEIVLTTADHFGADDMDALSEFAQLCKVEEATLRKNHYADLVDEVEDGHAFLAALTDGTLSPANLAAKLEVSEDDCARIGEALRCCHYFFARQLNSDETNPGFWMLLPSGEIALAALNERHAAPAL